MPWPDHRGYLGHHGQQVVQQHTLVLYQPLHGGEVGLGIGLPGENLSKLIKQIHKLLSSSRYKA